MNRQFYLDLARSGLRMPVGTDLVLHEQPDPQAVLRDGRALGRVLEQTARRYGTPLALGHMDLTLEKTSLLEMLDIPADQIPLYHFSECPGPEVIDRVARRIDGPLNPRLQAHVESIGYIAGHTDLIPVGMGIGPFSLMTKLLADPITPIYLAGSGVEAEDDPDVMTIEAVLELSLSIVLRSFSAQIAAGAKAVFVAEPAANVVYVSPRQMDSGSTIFDRYVGDFNRRLKQLLDRSGVDLLFHCCGELSDSMVRTFAALDPVILSLGSSRKLWEDARLVPERIVLYGNLPSKHFYSDDLITRREVERRACELIRRMRETGHPFILGSECDVLSVPGHEATIRDKVEAFVRCGCD
ncbi:MAG TPA: uroporphyrinogen decarboxylase family protein [Candidatus Methylomirabilis sp.]|nr:uroporphyrinogen decarboxylase family protein [Candidatus Methylomirabilis sp.]